MHPGKKKKKKKKEAPATTRRMAGLRLHNRHIHPNCVNIKRMCFGGGGGGSLVLLFPTAQYSVLAISTDRDLTLARPIVVVCEKRNNNGGKTMSTPRRMSVNHLDTLARFGLVLLRWGQRRTKTYATLDEKMSTRFAFVTRPSAMAKKAHSAMANPSRTLSDWM